MCFVEQVRVGETQTQDLEFQANALPLATAQLPADFDTDTHY